MKHSLVLVISWLGFDVAVVPMVVQLEDVVAVVAAVVVAAVGVLGSEVDGEMMEWMTRPS